MHMVQQLVSNVLELPSLSKTYDLHCALQDVSANFPKVG
jgi:hypothetical protein